MAKETLRIELKVDGTAQAVASTKAVQGGFLRLSGSVDQTRQRLLGLKTIMAGLAGGAIVQLVRSTVNAADNLSKLSTRIGVSVEDLSRLEFAAERSGVSFNALATSLQRQTRGISQAAAGTGEAVKALQELGLSAEKLKTLSPDKQFEVLADALNEVADSGDRVRLAQKFWETEGVQMLQIAEGGSEAIRALAQESDAMGRTMSGQTAKAAAQLNDQMRNISGNLEGVSNQMAQAVVPWLLEWARALNEKTVPAILNWWDGLDKVVKEIDSLSLARITDAMVTLAEEMDSVRRRLGHSW